MNQVPNISIGLSSNRHRFDELCTHPGTTSHGEVICRPKKADIGYDPAGFSANNRNFMSLTKLVGDIGERVVHTLLPQSVMT